MSNIRRRHLYNDLQSQPIPIAAAQGTIPAHMIRDPALPWVAPSEKDSKNPYMCGKCVLCCTEPSCARPGHTHQ